VDAVAGEEDRSLGGGDQRERAIDEVRGGSRARRRDADVDRVGSRRRVVRNLQLERLAGHPDIDRARRGGDRSQGSGADQVRHALRDLGLRLPLRDAGEDVDLFELLVLAAVPVLPAHGRGHRDDGARGPEGLGECAGNIRRARAVLPVHERRKTGDTGVGVGGVHSRCLAASQDLLDALLPERDPQRVVTAGDEEEVLDAEGPELLGDRFGRDGDGGPPFDRPGDPAGSQYNI
jgi:hypothetical protein